YGFTPEFAVPVGGSPDLSWHRDLSSHRGASIELAPAELRRVTQGRAGLLDAEECVESCHALSHRHTGKDFSHQLPAGPFHHGVIGGDDEGVGARDLRLERQPHALIDVALVNVPPEVPLPEIGV